MCLWRVTRPAAESARPSPRRGPFPMHDASMKPVHPSWQPARVSWPHAHSVREHALLFQLHDRPLQRISAFLPIVSADAIRAGPSLKAPPRWPQISARAVSCAFWACFGLPFLKPHPACFLQTPDHPAYSILCLSFTFLRQVLPALRRIGTLCVRSQHDFISNCHSRQHHSRAIHRARRRHAIQTAAHGSCPVHPSCRNRRHPVSITACSGCFNP